MIYVFVLSIPTPPLFIPTSQYICQPHHSLSYSISCLQQIIDAGTTVGKYSLFLSHLILPNALSPHTIHLSYPTHSTHPTRLIISYNLDIFVRTPPPLLPTLLCYLYKDIYLDTSSFSLLIVLTFSIYSVASFLLSTVTDAFYLSCSIFSQMFFSLILRPLLT